MSRYLFGGSSDDYAVGSDGKPVTNRRVRFYTSAALTTEITDLASDAAGTGSPLAVLTNTAGFWGPVYGPDGVTVMYAGAVDSAGNPPTYVVAVYTHYSSEVASFNGRTGPITLTKGDVTGTGLAASDIAADAAGAAAAAQTASAQKSANLSDLASAATARTNLGLGTAATQLTSAFDTAGAATAVQTNLTAEVTRAQAAEAALTGGMQFRTALVVATTNQTLSGLPTIDGVTLTAGQVALLTGQTAGSQNGLWAVASGAWARPANFAAGADATGTAVFVESGSTGATATYAVSGTSNNVIGTNVLTFVKTSGSGAYLARTASAGGVNFTADVTTVPGLGISLSRDATGQALGFAYNDRGTNYWWNGIDIATTDYVVVEDRFAGQDLIRIANKSNTGYDGCNIDIGAGVSTPGNSYRVAIISKAADVNLTTVLRLQVYAGSSATAALGVVNDTGTRQAMITPTGQASFGGSWAGYSSTGFLEVKQAITINTSAAGVTAALGLQSSVAGAGIDWTIYNDVVNNNDLAFSNGVRVMRLDGRAAVQNVIYVQSDSSLKLATSTTNLGFYGVTPIARALLATGAAHTVDDVITALQNLGLVRQS